MEEFADVARARETYALFAEAMSKGREILLRAGIAQSPPPVPEFDRVFSRLNKDLRQELFAELRKLENVTTPDSLRIWQAVMKKAFGPA